MDSPWYVPRTMGLPLPRISTGEFSHKWILTQQTAASCTQMSQRGESTHSIRRSEMRLPGSVSLGSWDWSFSVSSYLLAIPSAMVFLSLALKAGVNRWLNIVLGIVHIAILAGTFLVGNITTLYIFYAIAEFLLIALIVWQAWKWPRLEETRTVAQSPAGRYSR